MRLGNKIAIALVIAAIALHFTPKSAPAPGGLFTRTKVRVLETYDVNNKPVGDQRRLIDSPTFRAWVEPLCIKDGDVPALRIVPSNEVFNDDQPEFKKLMATPHSDNSLIISDDKKILSNTTLPANEADAEALIGKFAK